MRKSERKRRKEDGISLSLSLSLSLSREGDRREDWTGRAGSPIYKGELEDYDLPFVRSFQLFCPIKISIFSPITAALAGLLPLQCRLLCCPVLLPPLILIQPSHAALHTVASTVPNLLFLLLLLPSRDSSPSRRHSVVQPPSRFSSSLSGLFPLSASSVSFSLSRSLAPFCLSFPPPPRSFSVCLHLRDSNIQLLSARGPFAKTGKRNSRLRFLRAHKRSRAFRCSAVVRLV